MSNFDTRFIKFLSLLLVLGLMSGLTACGESNTRKFAQTKAESIIGGENIATNSKFTSRVIYLALGVERKKTPFGFTISQSGTCTASAISPRILITAAHCVEDLASEQVNAVLSINPWNHALNLAEWVQVEKIKIHEKYVNKENDIENDLALLRLSADLPPERISQLADPEQITVTQNLSLVSIGYGLTSALNNPPGDKNADTQKQASMLNYVMKNVENFDPTANLFQVDQSDMKGICKGDSGGPGYVFDQNKQDFYIVGITSFVSIFENEKAERDPNNIYNTCIGRGNYTNLLTYKDWINKTMNDLK